VTELSRLARTVRAWEAEILAFHTTEDCSNGPTEAVKSLIKLAPMRSVAGSRPCLPSRSGLLSREEPGSRWSARLDDRP
jgi:hypothetical protein